MVTEAEFNILKEENRQLKEENKQLKEQIIYLLKVIEDIGHKKNSKNSSKPPSHDYEKKRKKSSKSLRSNKGNKPGGQEGHKGSTLEKSINPDIETDLKNNYCQVCGCSLEDVFFNYCQSRQVIDLPEISPIYHEYHQYSAVCPSCQHFQKADFPPNVTAPVQYGPVIESLIAYFSVFQYVPFGRLKQLFNQVFNISLSEGTINNSLIRSSKKSQVVYDQIKTTILHSREVGSDETSARNNGKNWWVWVWQNMLNTYLTVTDNRGVKTIHQEFPEGLPNSTLISDRWRAQLKTESKNHQICLAHLLRDTVFVTEVENNQFIKELEKFIREIFRYKGKMTVFNQEKATNFEKRLNELLAYTLSKDNDILSFKLQQSLIKIRNYILPCIYNPDIPPDNNGSERAIRNLKVKMKISGQFKSNAQHFCVLRSVIDTIIKRNKKVLPILKQIMLFQYT